MTTKDSPRSSGKLDKARNPVEWSLDRNFRILSLAGGGIRGIFQSEFLSQLETRFLEGKSVGRFFDLIVGTSTGGIIALGLGNGMSAQEISRFYFEAGQQIFPPAGKIRHKLRVARGVFKNIYDPKILESHLKGVFGSSKLGDSRVMLCIPASEGHHKDVIVYKTDHHPDFQNDWKELMVEVAIATSAAPVYFKIKQDGSYKLLDGGLWANDPVLVGVIDALTSFDIARNRIDVLSITNFTGNHPISGLQIKFGGFFAFRKLLDTIFLLQSEGANGQASLLVGADSIIQVCPTECNLGFISLDDWKTAVSKLPELANSAADSHGAKISSKFFSEEADPYSRCRKI